MTYAENYEAARDHFSLVRNLSAASDANWSETARYFAADNEIRAGNFRRAVALIDEIAGSPTSQQYHRGMLHYFLLWRAHSVGDAVEAQACLSEAQTFVGTVASPQVAAQLFACQGHFALMRGDLEEACTLLSRAAEIGMDFSNPALLRCESDLSGGTGEVGAPARGRPRAHQDGIPVRRAELPMAAVGGFPIPGLGGRGRPLPGALQSGLGFVAEG